MSSEQHLTSHCGRANNKRRASITRQDASTEEDELVVTTTLADSMPSEERLDHVVKLCSLCGDAIQTVAMGTVSSNSRCQDCVTDHEIEVQTTLQLPSTRVSRCDSGNGSDILNTSSGNVSPSCSDYGGSANTDRLDINSLSRKHSKDSSLGSADSEPVEALSSSNECRFTVYEPTVIPPLQSSSTQCQELPPPPTVKVWPAADQSSPSNMSVTRQDSSNKSSDVPTDLTELNHIEELKKRGFVNWQHSLDQDSWTEDSETLSDISQNSHNDTLLRQSSADDNSLNMNNELSSSPKPSNAIGDKQSTSSQKYTARPSTDMLSYSIHEPVGVRPSNESISSIDGSYFSQIPDYDDSVDTFKPATTHHHTHHQHTHQQHTHDKNKSSLVLSSSSNEQASHKPTKVRVTKTRTLFTSPTRTASEDGTTSTSPKLYTRRRTLLRERVSEKELRELKVDVGLAEKVTPVSAPIGEDQVNTMFNSYSTLSVDSCNSVDSTLNTPSTPYLKDIKDPQKRWQAIKGIMPFMDRYKQQKWVQLAGHQGSFEQSAEESLVLKKYCALEHRAFTELQHDPLSNFIPKYHRIIEKDGHRYCELENLLHNFNSPCVMDCKIGVRTYLEDELVKAEKIPTPRKDMYEKMMKIDPDEPTEEEHAIRAVSKPRYMQWREKISSTSTLGFRIEGIKCSDGSSCINFKTSRDLSTIKTIISGFLNNNKNIVKKYLVRLKDLRKTLETSHFFHTHEIVGSSLLFVHDGLNAGVWMIDFGKTTPLDEGLEVTHRLPWERGNHEDGYVTGLDNLIDILQCMLAAADQT